MKKNIFPLTKFEVKNIEHYSSELFDYLSSITFAELKVHRLSGNTQEDSFGKKENINEHIQMLHREFIGRTEIELYNAILMVHIRRGIDLSNNLARVHDLWSCETEFLCKTLNSRWLVSTCDTFMDYAEDESERAMAAAAVLFTNTLKLYETERLATDLNKKSTGYKTQRGLVPLHDGLTSFVIGHGDMIANLHKRVQSICCIDSPAASILKELFQRASQYDTVFKRFKAVHQDENTMW